MDSINKKLQLGGRHLKRLKSTALAANTEDEYAFQCPLLLKLGIAHLLCISAPMSHRFSQISSKQMVGSVWHFGTACLTPSRNFEHYSGYPSVFH